MIELIIGDRQTGKTQRLIEKACQWALQGNSVGVMCKDQNATEDFIQRCVKYLNQCESCYVTNGYKIEFGRARLYPGSIIVGEDYPYNSNYLIFDDKKIVDPRDLELNKDIIISGQPSLVIQFNESKVDFKVEYLKISKNQNFTR